MAHTYGFDTDFSEHMHRFDASADQGAQGGTAWAVPWSDLMMVMFVLFVVLYVYASNHKDVLFVFTDRASLAQTDRSSLALDGIIARMNQRLEKSVSMPALEDKEIFYKSRLSGVSVVREQGAIRVVLRGPDFFEQGKVELLPGGVDYLVEVAELVRMTGFQVQVIGFADAHEPAGAEGFAFSASRASSVAAFFIDEAGIEPGRFSVTGRGIFSPEVPATTDKPDDINRRVEIVIHTGA